MLAWLQAVPNAPAGAAAFGRKANEQKTRFESMRDRNEPIEMPPVDSGGYLIDWLLDAGPDMAGAMGASALTWSEIDAWQRLTGHTLAPWEADLLRHLSKAFVRQSIEAKDPDCPPPWLAKPTDASRERVARQVAEAFGRRGKRNPGAKAPAPQPSTPPVPANVSPHEAGTGPGGMEPTDRADT